MLVDYLEKIVEGLARNLKEGIKLYSHSKEVLVDLRSFLELFGEHNLVDLFVTYICLLTLEAIINFWNDCRILFGRGSTGYE